MTDLFNAIKTQLETINDADGADTIKHIDIWNDQVNRVEKGESYTYNYPAVFVEFLNLENIKQLGLGYQLYDDLIVRLHTIHQQLDAGDGTLDRNIAVLTLKQSIFAKMNKFEPTQATQFARFSEGQDTSHTNLYHHMQDYRTNWVDVAAKQPATTVTKSPPTTLEITPVTIETEIDP